MPYLIYKLTGDNGLIYYGSTTNLQERLYKHKKMSPDRYAQSYKLEGKFKVEVMESNIPYKHIAVIRESYYIMNFPCINKQNPDGWWWWNIHKNEVQKKHREENRTQRNQQCRDCYENLKDERIECICGSKVHKYRMKRHLTSKKHKKSLNLI